MKKSRLQPLLDQVELIYQGEKQIALYFRKLQVNGLDGFTLNSVSREIEENKTHCERLEGLIEIIRTNLDRKLSPAQTEEYVVYCYELLRRFNHKHTAYNYENVLKSAELMSRQEIEDEFESVNPDVLCLQ